MKLKKIERPDWEILQIEFDSQAHLRSAFSSWYNDNVEPINKLLEDAVEVYSDDQQFEFTKSECEGDTHRALLINIEPIKKETAEDVLRDWLNFDGSDYNKIKELEERAKRVLEDNE